MEDTLTRCRVARVIDAAPEQVFEAWTNPELMACWISPNPEYYPHATVDLKVGGQYRIEMRHQGGMTHVAGGTYRVIDAPHRLEFTWGWIGGPMEGSESVVTVEFNPQEVGTEVVITHEFSGEGAEMAATEHEKGWTGCIDRLTNVYERTHTLHLSSLFALHRRLFDNVLEGVSEEHLKTRLTPDTNHLYWLAGHQASTRAYIAQMLGDTTVDVEALGIFNETLNDKADYPAMETIREVFQKASGAIMARLPHATT